MDEQHESHMDSSMSVGVLPIMNGEGSGVLGARNQEIQVSNTSLVLPLQNDVPPSSWEAALPSENRVSSATVKLLSTAASGVSAVSRPANVTDSLVSDALVWPTFGEFVDHQLVPLYIADIPFHYLQTLIEKYCGAPLDSDDEERAWKTIGVLPSLPAKKRKRVSNVHVELPSAELNHTKKVVQFGRLSEVARPDSSNQAALRPNMLTSVMEKRRKDRNAPPDMTLGKDDLHPQARAALSDPVIEGKVRRSISHLGSVENIGTLRGNSSSMPGMMRRSSTSALLGPMKRASISAVPASMRRASTTSNLGSIVEAPPHELRPPAPKTPKPLPVGMSPASTRGRVMATPFQSKRKVSTLEWGLLDTPG